MQIKGGGVPRSRYPERGAAELSREARQRLAWFDYYRARGGNTALTCRYFGISRQTLYRWQRRYDPLNLRMLEAGSHRPLKSEESGCRLPIGRKVITEILVPLYRVGKIRLKDWAKEVSNV